MMNKSLLAILVIAVAAQSVFGADAFTITEGNFYKAPVELITAADSYHIAVNQDTDGVSPGDVGLTSGKNDKTAYLLWKVDTYTNKDELTLDEQEGGASVLYVRTLDTSKLAVAKGTVDIAVSGLRWSTSDYGVGASVGNNLTVVRKAYTTLNASEDAEYTVKDLYAYVIDLKDPTNPYEILVASGSATNSSDYVSVSADVKVSNDKTVILYTLTTYKDGSEDSSQRYLRTLKGGKLSNPVTLSTDYRDWDVSAGVAYVVTQTSTGTAPDTLYTQSIVEYDLSGDDPVLVPAGAATINAQVKDTNTYSYSSIHAHPLKKERWVAIYFNRTLDDTAGTTTENRVAKANNDTGFSVLTTYTTKDADVEAGNITTYSSEVVSNLFGGLLVKITATEKADDDGIQKKTYSVQNFTGDLKSAGDAQVLLVTDGQYSKGSTTFSLQRLNNNKGVYAFIEKNGYDADADVGERDIYSGTYFGQLIKKSFGASLQTIFAACAFTFAAIFMF